MPLKVQAPQVHFPAFHVLTGPDGYASTCGEKATASVCQGHHRVMCTEVLGEQYLGKTGQAENQEGQNKEK